jgi:hypothetical protein
MARSPIPPPVAETPAVDATATPAEATPAAETPTTADPWASLAPAEDIVYERNPTARLPSMDSIPAAIRAKAEEAYSKWHGAAAVDKARAFKTQKLANPDQAAEFFKWIKKYGAAHNPPYTVKGAATGNTVVYLVKDFEARARVTGTDATVEPATAAKAGF